MFLASSSQASTFNQIQSSEFCIITLGAFNDCIPGDVSVCQQGKKKRSWVRDNDNQTQSPVKITQRIKLVDVFTLEPCVYAPIELVYVVFYKFKKEKKCFC